MGTFDPLRAYPRRRWPPVRGRRISAIVPTLDEAARIGGQIRLLQRIGVDEIVVVDGGSEDGTPEHAEAAGACVVSAPRGRGVQLNRGSAAATGDVLWFVHADARPALDSGAAILDTLDDPLTIGGAFRIRTVNDRAPSLIDALLPLADLRASYTLLPYGDQALFVRRDAFESAGGFPEQRMFEDVVIARRLWRIGRLSILPGPVRVSGRRFVQQPVRSTLCMYAFPLAWTLGTQPDTLEQWYTRVR